MEILVKSVPNQRLQRTAGFAACALKRQALCGRRRTGEPMTVDAEELVVLYRRKRDSFARQLDQDNDPYVQALLQLAIRYTHMCMAVAKDLQLAYLDYTRKVGDAFEQDGLSSERITAKAIASLKASASISDEQVRLQLIQFIKQSAHVQLKAGQSSLELTEAVYQLVELTANNFFNSLNNIFKSGDEEEALKALGILLEFLLGLVPVLGTLIGGYSAIRDIVDMQKEASEATTYLKRLKDYTTATFYWAVAAQVFIDGLAGVASDSEDARLNSAVEKITKRLEGLAA
jgi:hypothetical protein